MVTRGLADTSVLVAQEVGRRLDVACLPDVLAISVISLGELRAGVLTATSPRDRSRRLDTLDRAMRFDVLPIDGAVAAAWADLRCRLREIGRRMPVNDSWIAATAMASALPVVTQDGDFPPIDGLDVIRV